MTVRQRRWLLAVAGCGGAAYGIHLPLLRRREDFELSVVYDRDPRRAEQTACDFGFGKVADTPEALLDGVDMLVVLTPQHETLIEAALDARVNVFTEKPVSLDVSRTTNLIERARHLSLLFEVGAMRAHDPAVQEVLQHLQPTSGHFFKADGTDETARRAYLPTGFAPYTFDDDQPPAELREQSPRELRALQIMLWQGYHVLTALAVIAPSAVPRACVLDAGGRSLNAVLDGGQGLFSLGIGDAPQGLYFDRAHLIGEAGDASLHFGQPYGPGAATRLISASGERPYTSPFAQMWTTIAARLHDPTTGQDTTRIAVFVERLAAALAKLTDAPRHQPHRNGHHDH